MTSTEPRTLLALKHTNVSNPSIVVKRSQQSLQPSLTASEDYYSVSSGSSTRSKQDQRNLAAAHTITRFQTPPSRYHTPAQSRNHLAQYASKEEVKDTPMHGQGKRRQSPIGAERASGPDSDAPYIVRREGVKRKPVPSTVIESSRPQSEVDMAPHMNRSSVAQDMDREQSPPTPGADDTPYIRFALDQLTRDEEVRGSRQYAGLGSDTNDKNAQYTMPEPQTAQRQVPVQGNHNVPENWPLQQTPQRSVQRPEERTVEKNFHQQPQVSPSAMWAAQRQFKPRDDVIDEPPPRSPERLTRKSLQNESLQTQARSPPTQNFQQNDRLQTQARSPPTQSFEPPANRAVYPQDPHNQITPATFHTRQRSYDNRPLNKTPLREQYTGENDAFVPLSASEAQQERLRGMPTILKPLSMLLFLLLLTILLVLLLISAIWSFTHKGLWDYMSFGDSRYFVCQYLPTLLGVILFMWLVQIMVAVYRVAPFIAMSSQSHVRDRGARLPMYPKGFVLPYFGHFRAGLPIIGFFMVVAWLQIFTIPLLGSVYNVYFFSGQDHWRWTTTQAAAWVVIGLYVLLFIAIVVLLVWLRARNTGLKWDARSLADIMVLLERSNALEGFEIEEEQAQLGYWTTSGRSEVFHTYGVVDRPARRYEVEGGRIQEKTPVVKRLSDHEHEAGVTGVRSSSEKMIRRDNNSDDGESTVRHYSALPWFLRPSMASLWIVIALVLLLAFLIVSYLPSTAVSAGFTPDVSAPVNANGFSATNFLYSILPGFLGTLCLLFWLDIDYAYRHLQPYTALAQPDGELAEKSLLLAYTSSAFPMPSALANGHYRIALLSLNTLFAAVLPILAGGVFWAQFYVPNQSIRVYSHIPGYYALTVFVALYAVSYIFIFPTADVRAACAILPNKALSFADVIAVVHQSKLFDEVAFRAPRDRIDLQTRLLSVRPSGLAGMRAGEAGASKASLADSLRGLGQARQMAKSDGEAVELPRYYLGRCVGRNGRGFEGVDRLRK